MMSNVNSSRSHQKFVLHPLIHTLPKFNLAQNIGSLKGRDVEKKHPPPNGPAKHIWGQEEIMKSHQIDSYHLYLCTLPTDRKTNGLYYYISNGFRSRWHPSSSSHLSYLFIRFSVTNSKVQGSAVAGPVL